MSFLYWLESIRTPLMDKIMSFLTLFGDETLFLVITIVVFWCVSKKRGYFLMLVAFSGTVVNQFLKITFRIDRPWVKDPEFSAVESALEGASGYSFPSGHTQSSVGLFGGLALTEKNKVLRGIFVAMCVIVPFSRMYLGVHTPLDVFVSVGAALILLFAFNAVFKILESKPNVMWWIIGGLTFATVALAVYVKVLNLTDDSNAVSAEENAFKMLGCSVGLIAVWWADSKYIKFETQAVWWAQIIKCVVGLGVILLIKTFLKEPLVVIFGGKLIGDGVRYLLIVLFAGIVWPATFKYFSKLGVKKS